MHRHTCMNTQDFVVVKITKDQRDERIGKMSYLQK